MPRTKWKPVKNDDDFHCHQCGSTNVEYCIYTPSDEAYDDYHYHCLNCGYEWYCEGSDY